MDSPNTLTPEQNSPENFPRYLEINKNAVMLDDIDDCWHVREDDGKIRITPNTNKECDDVNLDFVAIHQEAQKYNEIHDLRAQLDDSHLQNLQQFILLHLHESWPKLSTFQRVVISLAVRPNMNIFGQLVRFGYDCLIRSNDRELLSVLENDKFVHGNVSGSNTFVMHNLATDFGANFSFIENVISACDLYFKKSARKRMRYTKSFHR